MFRKRIASVLAFIMLFSIAVPMDWLPSQKVNAATAKYLHLDFDTYSSEPSITGPTSVTGGGGSWSFFDTVAGTDYAYGEEVPGKAGKSFTIVSNTTGKNINIQKSNLTIPGENVTPVVVMEGRFKFNTTTHERRLFYANLTKLPNTTVLGYISVNLDAQGKMKLQYLSPTGNATVEIGDYIADQWYHIQVYADVQHKKLQVFVNGEQRISDLDTSPAWDNLRQFRFTQIGRSEEEGRMTIDDVKIYDFIPVTEVALDQSEFNLVPGSERQLSASIVPADSTNPYVTWASDSPAVAEVDEQGKVTGNSDGTATITVRSKENDMIVATSIVTVSSYKAVESVEIVPAAVQVETERSAVLEALIMPANATNKAVIWSSDSPSVATVNADGIVEGIATGTAIITATSEDGNKIGQSIVTVVPRSTAVEAISLPVSAQVIIDDTIRITPRFDPKDATDTSVSWLSDNEAVAVVNSSGIITGKSLGTATITATANGSIDPVSAAISVEVVAAKAVIDEFDEMRLKWKSLLDGGSNLNLHNAAIAQQVQDTHSKAAALWESMIVTEPRSTLWADIVPSTTDSSYFNTYMTRLRDMTYAYSMKGGELYHNVSLLEDIIAGLDWVYEHAYNENIVEYGNWWNFDIGAPLRVMDIMVMLYDHLSTEQINRFIRTADHFIGDIMDPAFNSSGANRSDVMTIETIMGILSKDAERLENVLVQLKPLFVYVTEGDGFYEDGSYIQHSTIPYTGSYGEVLIRGIGNLFYLLNDSAWEVTDPNAVNVYRWIYESISPVVYRGETMDMIRGRAIAREALSGHQATIGIMSGIIRLAMAAPEEDALHFRQMIKHWLLTTDPALDVYSSLRIDLIEPTEAIMNDPSIIAVGDLPAHVEFGAMNRTVHYAEDFAFGISKSSRRIATYELTNGENGEGWYTGDGMTYLYTSDSTQFSDDFWPTVNRYRLPGTTVDTRPRKNDHYQYGDGETTPNNTWAGGVVLGYDGVSGMNLQQVGTTLRANKSWFMFDNTIVALGSGITSGDNRTIETIVEQRKINSLGDNTLIIDGVTQPTTVGWSDDLDNASWFHLQGNTAGSDIGYYFPEQQSLKANRTANSGAWYDINQNDSASKDVRTRNYVSFWFDHGNNPVDATYSYVLLPNRTPAETEQFAAAPTINIIENSQDAHAVQDLSTNQLGINYWKDQVTTVAGVTSNRQASVLMKENEDHTLEIAVSDPTFTNTGAIEIEIDQSAAAVLSADSEVFITQLHPTIKFKVSTKDSLSRSFIAKFDMDPNKARPDAEAAIPVPTNSKEPASTEVPIAHVYSLFDHEKLGNQPNNWTINHSANTMATVEASPNNADQLLRFLDRNTEGSVVAMSTFAPESGFLKASWKFADLGGASGTTFSLMNGDRTAAELVSRAGGLYYVDGSGMEHVVKATQAAHWYTIDLYLDVVSGQWDIFVDGEPGVLNATFKNLVPELDRIQIATGDAEADVAVYVDDVAVYVTGAIPLIADEFETYELNGSPGDWVILENKTNAPITIVYEEEDRNKSVLMDDQNTSFRSTMQKAFTPQTGRLVAQWRYKELGGGKYPEFQLLNNTTQAIRLSSSSNNYLRYYGPGASANSTAEKAKTKVNTWHTVKLDIDVSTQTYDIYFDGVLVESALTFYNEVQQIDGILFGSAYGAADAPLYIDSVKVYAYDTAAPSWESETAMNVTNITAFGLTLEWPHAVDNVAVGAYKLLQNDQLLQTISGNTASYQVTGLSPLTEYSFAIQAVDTSGNASLDALTVTTSTLAAPSNPEASVDPSSPSDKENNAGEVIITASQWAELVAGAKAGIVPIEADGRFLMLPMSLLDMEQLAKELNAEPTELNIRIIMGKAADASASAFKKVAESNGLVMVSDVLQFGLSVPANGFVKEINHFGQTYVERRLVLDAAADLTKLTVVQIDPVSGALQFVPAQFVVIDGVKTAVIKSINTGLFAIAELSKSFEDTNNHWANSEITDLASKLLVKGMTESLFMPDATITRAQFTALLVRSLGLYEQSEGVGFSDVSEQAWYHGALSAAVDAGLIQGYADHSFRPDAPVSREEMAVLIVRAMQFAGHSIVMNNESSEVLSKFEDRDQIQAWASSAVAELTQAGVIQGITSDSFAPSSQLTRAQTAVVLKRMLSMLKFI